MTSRYKKDASSIKQELDKISPSMCYAKWTQVTMHLHNGHTHSCHHPAPHYIPLEEIKNNPYALHNTSYKINTRKLMLEGKQPTECKYCWNIENLNKGHFSDRHYKSGEEWNNNIKDVILQDPLRNNFLPTYLEVSFNNTCNFSCMYCSPQISSKWLEDIKNNGAYDLGDFKYHSLEYMKENNLIPIPEREENPYIEAFWKIWPELYQNLKVFRITGGEPLLSKHTWKILEYIQQNPNPNLSLAINTNLGVQDRFIDKLIEISIDLVNNNKIKNLDIYTSVESFGKQAEYIRDGMDFNNFITNLEKVLQKIPTEQWKAKIVIMATYNLLSVPNFRQLLEWVYTWRSKNVNTLWKILWLDISYLTYPSWQSINLIDNNLLQIVENDLEYMKNKSDNLVSFPGFQDTEIEKFSRVKDFIKQNLNNDKLLDKIRFYHFFNQYDKRKNKNFLETFPQLADLYNECRKIAINK